MGPGRAGSICDPHRPPAIGTLPAGSILLLMWAVQRCKNCLVVGCYSDYLPSVIATIVIVNDTSTTGARLQVAKTAERVQGYAGGKRSSKDWTDFSIFCQVNF